MLRSVRERKQEERHVKEEEEEEEQEEEVKVVAYRPNNVIPSASF